MLKLEVAGVMISKITFFLLVVSVISIKAQSVLKRCLHCIQSFVRYYQTRGGNLENEDSNALDLLTSEEKRLIELNLELNSLNKLKEYIEADYIRIAQARHTLLNKISILDDEINKLRQGQLIL
jgi:septal ring factor EnvC (AmiA/AmiB activator)